jgi:hypothetical protein
MTSDPSPIDHDRPETFPVYQLLVRVAGSRSETVVVGLKNTGLDVHFPDGQVLHYDLEGRLLRVAARDVQWLRGLTHRTIELRRVAGASAGRFARRRLEPQEADAVAQSASERVSRVRDAWEDGSRQVVKRAEQEGLTAAAERVLVAAARFDTHHARADAAAFRAIHGEIPILPPDQYASWVLLATEGCRYNQCAFCSLYRGVPHRVKSATEFGEHLAASRNYHGRGLARRRGIFLGQANALLGSPAWRTRILQVVGESVDLPAPEFTRVDPRWWQGHPRRFDGVSSFLDAFSGVAITSGEFAAMRQLNLRRIYIGLESGDRQLLRWLRKPATPAQVLQTVQAAKAGGLRVGVVVLIGAGGERFFDAHVRGTVELVRAMPLAPGDFVYLSPLVIAPETGQAPPPAAEGITRLSSLRMREQEQLIRRGIRGGTPSHGPYVARYDVEQFLY